MRRVLALGTLTLALSSVALLAAPSLAQACSCMPSPGALEAAQASDVVFSAKLVSVADVPADGAHGMPSKLFTFTVTNTYKGQLDAEVRVSTADNSAACGRNYGAPGSEWLIYAGTTGEGQLRDNLCSRTMALADASEDIGVLEANADKLDKPAEPEPEAPGPAEPEPEPIEPGAEDAVDGGPEPAKPSKKGCATTDEPGPGGLGLILGLGLLLGLRRRA